MGQNMSQLYPKQPISQNTLNHLKKRFIICPHPFYSTCQQFKLMHQKLTNKKYILRIMPTNSEQHQTRIENSLVKRLAHSNLHLTKLQNYILEEEQGICGKTMNIYLQFQIEEFTTLREEILKQQNSRPLFSEEQILKGMEQLIEGLLFVKFLKETHGSINTFNIYYNKNRMVLADPLIAPQDIITKQIYPSPQKLMKIANTIEDYDKFASDLFSIGMCMLQIIKIGTLQRIYKNKGVNFDLLTIQINKCQFPKVKNILNNILLGGVQIRKQYLANFVPQMNQHIKNQLLHQEKESLGKIHYLGNRMRSKVQEQEYSNRHHKNHSLSQFSQPLFKKQKYNNNNKPILDVGLIAQPQTQKKQYFKDIERTNFERYYQPSFLPRNPQNIEEINISKTLNFEPKQKTNYTIAPSSYRQSQTNHTSVPKYVNKPLNITIAKQQPSNFQSNYIPQPYIQMNPTHSIHNIRQQFTSPINMPISHQTSIPHVNNSNHLSHFQHSNINFPPSFSNVNNFSYTNPIPHSINNIKLANSTMIFDQRNLVNNFPKSYNYNQDLGQKITFNRSSYSDKQVQFVPQRAEIMEQVKTAHTPLTYKENELIEPPSSQTRQYCQRINQKMANLQNQVSNAITRSIRNIQNQPVVSIFGVGTPLQSRNNSLANQDQTNQDLTNVRFQRPSLTKIPQNHLSFEHSEDEMSPKFIVKVDNNLLNYQHQSYEMMPLQKSQIIVESKIYPDASMVNRSFGEQLQYYHSPVLNRYQNIANSNNIFPIFTHPDEETVENNHQLVMSQNKQFPPIVEIINNHIIPEEAASQEESIDSNYANTGHLGQYQVIQFDNGGKYAGFIHHGKRNGDGTFYYKDGGFYEGQWKDNMMNGYGKLYYTQTQLAYEGDWVNDQFHGKGKVCNDHPEEVINFNFNKFQHDGKWKYYQGQLAHDIKEGYGRLVISNGEYFIGKFTNDLPNGEGHFFQKNGNTIHGFWKNGILVVEN